MYKKHLKHKRFKKTLVKFKQTRGWLTQYIPSIYKNSNNIIRT